MLITVLCGLKKNSGQHCPSCCPAEPHGNWNISFIVCFVVIVYVYLLCAHTCGGEVCSLSPSITWVSGIKYFYLPRHLVGSLE